MENGKLRKKLVFVYGEYASLNFSLEDSEEKKSLESNNNSSEENKLEPENGQEIL